jgi:hypothetical protein
MVSFTAIRLFEQIAVRTRLCQLTGNWDIGGVLRKRFPLFFKQMVDCVILAARSVD